jgi:hypothetical protein
MRSTPKRSVATAFPRAFPSLLRLTSHSVDMSSDTVDLFWFKMRVTIPVPSMIRPSMPSAQWPGLAFPSKTPMATFSAISASWLPSHGSGLPSTSRLWRRLPRQLVRRLHCGRNGPAVVSRCHIETPNEIASRPLAARGDTTVVLSLCNGGHTRRGSGDGYLLQLAVIARHRGVTLLSARSR